MDKRLSREECGKIQLQILDEIKSICEKNNLHYYLAYGSFLGAVRHGGFIPWDDDIDICLHRNDYDKLINILKSTGQQNEYQWLGLVDGDIPGYYYTFVKAVDNRTIAKMEDNLTEHGVWIDIFPLDTLPASKFKRKCFLRYCYFLRAVILSMTTDFSGGMLGKKTIIKKIFNQMSNFIGKDRIYKHYLKKCCKYKNSESKYVGVLFSAYGIRDCMLRDKTIESKEYVFEDHNYMGFVDYDYYLSHIYGDYMKVPPKEKQRTHSIIAYWKF